MKSTDSIAARSPARPSRTVDYVSLAVRSVLSRVHGRVGVESIRPQTSVIDDLGLDSVRFVDLAVMLEDALGIDEFPLQEWYDAEAARCDSRFTVQSLVEACLRCVGDGGGADVGGPLR